MKTAATLALRVDACTFRGVRDGIPRLIDALGKRRIRATFLAAMGPDRSGLALLRAFRRRGFIRKMIRTNAAALYGIRTALQGTLLPAPSIAARLGDVLRRAAGEGHEMGIHSFDHVRWQDRLDRMSPAAIREDYERAIDAFTRVLGTPPAATAAPAWLASGESLEALEGLGFVYASDTRGRAPFLPAVEGRTLSVPQVPVTLPTLDELLGSGGMTPARFFERILASLDPGAPNVLTVHAEAEGGRHLAEFERFLDRALAAGWLLRPLGEIASQGALPACAVERAEVPGRAGEVSVQGEEGRLRIAN